VKFIDELSETEVWCLRRVTLARLLLAVLLEAFFEPEACDRMSWRTSRSLQGKIKPDSLFGAD
jgi:hypothetical protein